MKLKQNDALKRSSRVPAWLVMAFCIIGTVRSLFSPATLLLLPTCCILFIVSGILTGCGKPAPEQEKPAEKPASSEVVAEKKEPPAEPAGPAKPTEPAEQAKPEEVYLAYTVNNLGYTATCG